MTPIHRYIAKSRKRVGGFLCERCGLKFGGRNAYDRHLVWDADLRNDPNNPGKDWCHLPEEVGLIPGVGGYWRLPGVNWLDLYIDPQIVLNGGIARFPAVSAAQ